MKKLLKSKPALIAIAVCVLLLGIGGASDSGNQELKDQLAQVTTELDTTNNQNETLSQQIQDLSSTIEDLTAKNEELQTSLDEANIEISKLNTKNTTTKSFSSKQKKANLTISIYPRFFN